MPDTHITQKHVYAMPMTLLKEKPHILFLLFVIVHMVFWTLLPTLVNPNLPYDVIEGLGWGHEWQLGYYKHPPVKPWFIEIAAVLSGRGDWAQYLLSQICIAIAFWAMWRLAKDFFNPISAVITVLLLEGVYYHNYTSPEFNVNVAQLPFWAMTVFFTWRGITRNSPGWWALAGVCIGFGFLSKYIFLFLVAAIFIMLLSVKSFRPLLKSPGPWLGAFIALVIAAPHLSWVVQNKFATIAYGLQSVDAGKSATLNHIFYPLRFIICQSLILIPSLIMLLTLKKSKEEDPGEGDASSEKTMFLLFISLGPPLFMTLISSIFGWKLRAMWGTPLLLMSGITLVYFLYHRISFDRFRGFTWAFAIFFFLSLFAYWGVAVIGPSFTKQAKRTQFPGRALAATTTEKWHAHFSQPPEIIIGSYWNAGNIGYYAPHRASVFIDADPAKSPWISLSDIQKKGAIVIGHNKVDAYQLVPPEITTALDEGPITLAPEHDDDLAPIELWVLILPPEPGK